MNSRFVLLNKDGRKTTVMTRLYLFRRYRKDIEDGIANSGVYLIQDLITTSEMESKQHYSNQGLRKTSENI